MAADEQGVDLARRSPRQARATQTVETILEATARILVEEGGAKLTTNHLARRAGFSIGTVYQYFPNREAIVLALIDRQREETGRRIAAMLAERPHDGAAQKIAGIVRILHEAFAVHRMPERRLALALLQIAVTRGLPAPSDDIARTIAAIWAESEGEGGRPLNASEIFVLTRALIEVLRHAALHASPLLGTAEFEAAMQRLILGFLRAGAGSLP